MSETQVAILMGSDNDYEVMSEAAAALKDFGITFDVQVLSAHRCPDLLREYVLAEKKKGIRVYIAGAGGAAHLAGVIAAHTTLPVIAVPIASTPLAGFDSLLAMVQMPAGIPVATVAVGKAGARNAGILAAQILAIADAKIAKKLEEFKKDMIEGVKKKNAKLQEKVH